MAQRWTLNEEAIKQRSSSVCLLILDKRNKQRARSSNPIRSLWQIKMITTRLRMRILVLNHKPPSLTSKRRMSLWSGHTRGTIRRTPSTLADRKSLLTLQQLGRCGWRRHKMPSQIVAIRHSFSIGWLTRTQTLSMWFAISRMIMVLIWSINRTWWWTRLRR